MNSMKPDNPIVVAIYVAAAIATILTFLLIIIDRRRDNVSNTSESAETSEADYNISAPTELSYTTNPPAPDNTLNSASTTTGNNPKSNADIKFDCKESTLEDKTWHWICSISNNSDKIIWWRDSFENEGSELKWFCLERGAEQSCRASTLEDNKINFPERGSIKFKFLNPHESIDFWVNCHNEPAICGIAGRAPGLVVEGPSFFYSGN